MKERLTEIKQWWDKAIKEDVDSEKEQEEEEHSLVAEEDITFVFICSSI